MKPKRLYRLQASWYFEADSNGTKLYSLIYGKALTIAGVESSLCLDLLELCRRGFICRDAISFLSISAGLSEEVVTLIFELLISEGILLEVVMRDSEETNPEGRFSRQQIFLSLFETPFASGRDLNDSIRRHHVAIIGVGGYGSWVAMLCAQIGIETITLVDGDLVEVSNLSRQSLYTTDDIGHSKVLSAAQALKRIYPEIECKTHVCFVNTADQLSELLKGCNFVFNPYGYSSDPSGLGVIIAEAAHILGIPSLSWGGSQFGPLNIPGINACYFCLINDTKLAHKLGKPAGQTIGFQQGAFAPRLAINSSIAVWEASRFLGGLSKSPLLDNILSLDTVGYGPPRFHSCSRNPECVVCGDKAIGITS